MSTVLFEHLRCPHGTEALAVEDSRITGAGCCGDWKTVNTFPVNLESLDFALKEVNSPHDEGCKNGEPCERCDKTGRPEQDGTTVELSYIDVGEPTLDGDVNKWFNNLIINALTKEGRKAASMLMGMVQSTTGIDIVQITIAYVKVEDQG